MIHETWCHTNGPHSDPAKRISDHYAVHRLADPIGSIGHWFGVALADGTSDGTLYDSRRDCVIHQKHNESYYAYIQIIPGYMNECQAESFLSAQRKLFEADIRLTDRDHHAGGISLIPRVTFEDQMAQMFKLTGGKRHGR